MFEIGTNAFLACWHLEWTTLFNQDIWQWSELTGFGDLPSPRDFAAASSIGNRKIVMWDL